MFIHILSHKDYKECMDEEISHVFIHRRLFASVHKQSDTIRKSWNSTGTMYFIHFYRSIIQRLKSVVKKKEILNHIYSNSSMKQLNLSTNFSWRYSFLYVIYFSKRKISFGLIISTSMLPQTSPAQIQLVNSTSWSLQSATLIIIFLPH